MFLILPATLTAAPVDTIASSGTDRILTAGVRVTC
jgi:hypothetical protein